MKYRAPLPRRTPGSNGAAPRGPRRASRPRGPDYARQAVRAGRYAKDGPRSYRRVTGELIWQANGRWYIDTTSYGRLADAMQYLDMLTDSEQQARELF